MCVYSFSPPPSPGLAARMQKLKDMKVISTMFLQSMPGKAMPWDYTKHNKGSNANVDKLKNEPEETDTTPDSALALACVPPKKEVGVEIKPDPEAVDESFVLPGPTAAS